MRYNKVMEAVSIKVCNTCKQSKPQADFSKDSSKPDGFCAKCKDCFKIYYSANREKQICKAREWQLAHAEHSKSYQYQYRKAKGSAIQRLWRKNNPEKYAAQLAKQRRYFIEHPDKYAACLEKHRRYLPIWQSSLTGEKKERLAMQFRASARKRRARKAEAGGAFTDAEWSELCEKHGNKCLACGRADVKLAADHVVPLAKGGSNNIGNIQPLCRSCNSRKGVQMTDYRLGKEV